jgi:hypothetical protein
MTFHSLRPGIRDDAPQPRLRGLATGTANDLVFKAQSGNGQTVRQLRRRRWQRKVLPFNIKDFSTYATNRMIVILRCAIHPESVTRTGNPAAQAVADEYIERLVYRGERQRRMVLPERFMYLLGRGMVAIVF